MLDCSWLLWEVYVIVGLWDCQFVVYYKMYYVVVDGIMMMCWGVELLCMMLDDFIVMLVWIFDYICWGGVLSCKKWFDQVVVGMVWKQFIVNSKCVVGIGWLMVMLVLEVVKLIKNVIVLFFMVSGDMFFIGNVIFGCQFVMVVVFMVCIDVICKVVCVMFNYVVLICLDGVMYCYLVDEGVELD